MDEKSRATELKLDFEVELNKTINQLTDMYPRVSRVKTNPKLSNDVFETAIYTALLNTLRELQLDSNKLTMREFHYKYTSNLPILYRCDFTCDEYGLQ